MSSAPVGTSWPLISLMLRASRRASGTPRRADADERQLLDPAIALDDLVRDPGQRPADAIAVHHERHEQQLRDLRI